MINLLLAKVRLKGHIALATASSGIAATLLTGGRTAHSTFRLPLNMAVNESPTCSISKNSNEGELMKKARLIVIDECSMLHKRAFEAIDRMLKDLRDSNRIFGGVTVLIAGDFRQCLPVVTSGSSADQLYACPKASYLWQNVQVNNKLSVMLLLSHVNNFQVLKLCINMRARTTGDSDCARFAAMLLQTGNGSLPHVGPDQVIQIPQNLGTCVSSLEILKRSVYPNLSTMLTDTDWLRDRAILAPKNSVVDTVNASLLAEMEGQVRTYLSVDTVFDQDEAVNFPMDFLNSLTISGLPPHKLDLKIGTPVMLLRNLGKSNLIYIS